MTHLDTTLGQLKNARRMLEAGIAKRIKEFEEDTGVAVSDIQIERYRALSGYGEPVIKALLDLDINRL